MTTTADVLEPGTGAGESTEAGALPAVAPRRTRTGLRLLAGFVLGLLACVGLVLGGLLAWDAAHDGRVLPGVRVGDVDLSGLDRAQAVTALTEAYGALADGRVVIRTAAGDVAVPYAQFDRRPAADAMVAEALEVGRAGTPAERAVGQVRLAITGHSLAPRLVQDEDALADAVGRALIGQERPPLDATITLDEEGFHTTHARDGRAFDVEAATTTALEAVRRLDAPAEVVVEAPSIAVPAARSDSDVEATRVAAERMVGDVIVRSGKKEWKIKATTVRSWVRLETGMDGNVVAVADPELIGGSLRKVARDVKRPPVSAAYLGGKSGGIVGVAPGSDGRRLDRAATATAIAEALIARGRGQEPGPVNAVLERVPPKLTTDEAVAKAPLMELLGSWKTWFPVSERNYFGANIWLPARFIDGTVLSPGERFEWWRAVGPITSARGFGLGGYIAGDHTEPTGAIGGGMCSSSTTLFNAALRAGLKMGARSNHRYYINRYPLGLDATVSGGLGRGQTMSFTNDMKHPIVIRGFRYRANGLGWVRYEIWGIPDGRKVTIGRPVVSNVRKATTYTVRVSTLPRGVREQTEYPSNGMDVSVTRVVRNRSGSVIHSETYRSHYMLWNGRIEIGR